MRLERVIGTRARNPMQADSNLESAAYVRKKMRILKPCIVLLCLQADREEEAPEPVLMSARLSNLDLRKIEVL